MLLTPFKFILVGTIAAESAGVALYAAPPCNPRQELCPAERSIVMGDEPAEHLPRGPQPAPKSLTIAVVSTSTVTALGPALVPIRY